MCDRHHSTGERVELRQHTACRALFGAEPSRRAGLGVSPAGLVYCTLQWVCRVTVLFWVVITRVCLSAMPMGMVSAAPARARAQCLWLCRRLER